MAPSAADSTKRSRSNHSGSAGLCLRNLVQSVYAMAAAPIGMPGCPEFACCTASADNMRTVLMHRFSSSLFGLELTFILRALHLQTYLRGLSWCQLSSFISTLCFFAADLIRCQALSRSSTVTSFTCLKR